MEKTQNNVSAKAMTLFNAIGKITSSKNCVKKSSRFSEVKGEVLSISNLSESVSFNSISDKNDSVDSKMSLQIKLL